MSQSSLSPSGAVLSAEMAEQVAQRAGRVAGVSMPLEAGLRAAALETDSWKLRRALETVARELERGRSLDECLTHGRHIPPYLAGLIVAARRTGDFGNTIAQWSENRRSARQHWR